MFLSTSVEVREMHTCVVHAIVDDGVHLSPGFNGDEVGVDMSHLTVLLGFDPVL